MDTVSDARELSVPRFPILSCAVLAGSLAVLFSPAAEGQAIPGQAAPGMGGMGAAADPEDDEAAPEPFLPRPPQPFPLVPLEPVVLAPDARDLLKACTEPSFIDCFREWEPPPPPPEPEKVPPPPPSPPKPGEPRGPAEPGGATGGKPPPPQPEADLATYEALVRAIREVGLEGKVRLPDPPKEGSTTMTLDSQKKAPAKP